MTLLYQMIFFPYELRKFFVFDNSQIYSAEEISAQNTTPYITQVRRRKEIAHFDSTDLIYRNCTEVTIHTFLQTVKMPHKAVEVCPMYVL
jgi:hypothetical protein